MLLHRVVSVVCLVVMFATGASQAQETAARPAGSATAAAQSAWGAIQREVQRLRAAGHVKEAVELERQAQQSLSRLLQQFQTARALRLQQQDPATHQIARAKYLIRQVREEVGQDDAQQLAKRLEAIEQMLATGGLAGPEDNAPEVHAVQINAGTALPEEFAEGRDDRKVGYAEVALEHPARPIILVLNSSRPTLWNIKSGDSRVVAVLRNNTHQELVGVGDCPVLVGSGSAASLRAATGRATATFQSFTEYGGGPVTIGPSNPGWLTLYLAPRVEEIQEDAKARLTRSRVATLSKLRFSAAHRYESGQSISTAPGVSYGQFTIAGPIANSLVPVPSGVRTAVVMVAGAKPMRFALSSVGKLVMASGDGTTFEPIPVPAALVGINSFTGFCLDTKRNRLILSQRTPGSLCSYEIASGKWSRLAKGSNVVSAVVYRPHDDTLFGIAGALSAQGPPLSLLTFTPEGAVATTADLVFTPDANANAAASRGTRPLPFWDPGMQLVLADDMLALIFAGARQQAMETPLKLIDPRAGTVVYEGPLRVHQGEDPVTVLTRPLTRPPTQAIGLLPRVEHLLGEAEQVRQRLVEQDAERGKQFAAQLRLVRSLMRHGTAMSNQEPHYLVTQYSQAHKQPVRIHFSDTSGPATLRLSSSRRPDQDASIAWHVTVASGAQLKEVIVFHAMDSVKGLPEGTRVVRGAVNQPTPPHLIRFNPPLVVGTETVLTIGPDNGQWRAELAQVELRRMIADSEIELESPVLMELEQQRFFAVERGARNKPSYFAEFTIRGPVIGTKKVITLKSDDKVLGVAANHVYVAARSRGLDVTIAAIDVATDTRESISSPRLRGFPGRRVSAIDLRNQRLYLATSDGINVLDLQSRRWSDIRGRRMGINEVITYNPAMDMLYDLGLQNTGRGNVRRYNFRGALLDNVPLQVKTTYRSSRASVQTIGIDHYMGELHYSNGRGSIQVTDLENGDAVYQGQLVRHIPRREIPLDELVAMYRRLGTEHEESDRLMWEMSAGQQGTVAFLDRELPVPLAVEVDIKPIVMKLDSAKFVERVAAFKELQRLGSRVEPSVRRALKTDLSAEAKDRLERLIKAWETAKPQNSKERRQVHAVVVLERVGSSSAKALLRQIADGRGSPVAIRAARETLQRMN